MTDPSTFVPNQDALLAPIASDAPCGPSMRYHAVYAGIRQAREEEDASLPMGVWERTLKKADWQAVETQCIDLLTHHSKDLQVAAWLLEAWLQLYQIRGFNAGIALLQGLVEHYWDSVHPLIEDGDDDARAAPFVWINENLSRTLLLKLQLLKVPECTPSVVTLVQWEQAVGQERQQGMENSTEQLGEKPLTRERILAATQGQTLQGLLGLYDGLLQAKAQWQALIHALDDRMTVNPPSISRVAEMLLRIERLAANLIDGRFPQPIQQAPQPPDAVGASLQLLEPTVPDQARALAAMPQGFTSREDAYRLLEVIASYLQELEPHSPTPYLVRRAVKWGGMPLGELMQEILREEGDVARFFSLLGVDER